MRAMIQWSLKIAGSATIMGVVVYLIYNYSMTAFDLSRLAKLMLAVFTVLIGVTVYLAFLYLLIDSVKGRMKIDK